MGDRMLWPGGGAGWSSLIGKRPNYLKIHFAGRGGAAWEDAMSIKAILVALAGMESESSVLDTALQVARLFDAHLEVLHVRADPNEVFAFMTEPMSESSVELIIDAAEKGTAELAAKARARFDEFCQANGVTVAEAALAGGGVCAIWREETGEQGQVIAHHGRLADLSVVARPAEDAPAPVMLEAALLETGKPVLMVPAEARTTLCANVVIAWNGTAEASRAVAAAMPFLEAADKVTVLTAKEDGQFVADAADLTGYLSWHGVTASTGTINIGATATGEALLGEAGRIGADLLVMGGYGHSRVREVILGGVTHHILGNADLPVLMAH